MDVDGFLEAHRRLGPVAHLATVTGDGRPHVTPIRVTWYDGCLYSVIGREGAKARNVRQSPRICLHYQVDPRTDWTGLMVWGLGAVLGSVADKTRLWSGVFTADLDRQYPDGPESAQDIGFLRLTIDRAVLLHDSGHRDEWRPAVDRAPASYH
ncbi:MAG: pyridoxamine 5'-phosphate oxidase family protein [Acidimicrobiales bacterium]